MKPSEALTALSMLSSMVTDMEVRWRSMCVAEESIRAALDDGKIDLIEAGHRAADIIVLERGEPTDVAPPVAAAVTPPDDAPYGRRADGAPKARPGRKAKEAPAVNLSSGETEQAKAPVDEAKSAIDIKAIRSALEGGPLTVGELVMNSGVSHPDVMRHLAAGAVIEEYTAARGEGLEPLPLVRLISQRTS